MHSNRKRSKSSESEDSDDIDDSVGHYDGAKGSVIADRCKTLYPLSFFLIPLPFLLVFWCKQRQNIKMYLHYLSSYFKNS